MKRGTIFGGTFSEFPIGIFWPTRLKAQMIRTMRIRHRIRTGKRSRKPLSGETAGEMNRMIGRKRSTQNLGPVLLDLTSQAVYHTGDFPLSVEAVPDDFDLKPDNPEITVEVIFVE